MLVALPRLRTACGALSGVIIMWKLVLLDCATASGDESEICSFCDVDKMVLSYPS